MIQERREALIIVDVQNDFCPGGNLAVTEGDKVVEPINELIAKGRETGMLLIATRDWHPRKTTHFLEFGGKWPPHCIAGTKGAEFHPNLDIDEDITIFSKGTEDNTDSYTGFDGKEQNGWTLEQFLKMHRIQKVNVVGLATDYCVKATAIDAAAHFETTVLTDAIRAVNINPTDEEIAFAEMAEAKIKFATTGDVIANLI